MNQFFSIEKFSINSKVLKQDRNCFVCIPKDFENVELPSLYLLDGGENEKLEFVLNEISALLAQKIIKPFIIIGIENIDRNYDFTNNTSIRKDRKWVPKYGNAKRFKNFIIEELIPFVDSNFKTSENRTIIGESLGGLLVLDIMYQHPESFRQYIAVDPSLWWNNNELLDLFKTNYDVSFLESIKVCISSSKTVFIRNVTDIFHLWINDKIEKSNYNYEIDDIEDHFTIFKANFSQIIKRCFN